MKTIYLVIQTTGAIHLAFESYKDAVEYKQKNGPEVLRIKNISFIQKKP